MTMDTLPYTVFGFMLGAYEIYAGLQLYSRGRWAIGPHPFLPPPAYAHKKTSAALRADLDFLMDCTAFGMICFGAFILITVTASHRTRALSSIALMLLWGMGMSAILEPSMAKMENLGEVEKTEYESVTNGGLVLAGIFAGAAIQEIKAAWKNR